MGGFMLDKLFQEMEKEFQEGFGNFNWEDNN